MHTYSPNVKMLAGGTDLLMSKAAELFIKELMMCSMLPSDVTDIQVCMCLCVYMCVYVYVCMYSVLNAAI